MFKAKALSRAIVASLGLAAVVTPAVSDAAHFGHGEDHTRTTTPIKHVVVIFQENVSFDHYFGTYPHALNPAGEPRFVAAKGTPTVNGLTEALLNNNPNAANPMRLDRTEALTCDQDHGYTAEQKAFNRGLMDKFVENTNRDACSAPESSRQGLVMDYYDGNTVTALWNYAQHFAMSDNSFNTTFGPSTPGALNLVSGQTHGAISTQPDTDTYGVVSPDANGVGTVINDPNPTYDDCSSSKYPTVSMVDGNKNIGDLLNAKGVTWGWFEGGFRPTSRDANGNAICGATHQNIGGATVTDYIPHHEPFQYYKSTSNPHHLAPTSVSMIGRQDQANHQYDLSDFWAAVDAGNMPAVSFLKAAGYQDGHAGYSDPLDEQTFIVNTINRLQKSPDWRSTAVIIAYDDSDGWYDHVMSPIVSQSNDVNKDALSDVGMCGETGSGKYSDRCGYGPRLPLLVVSPWAKKNFVDHSVTDQSSVLRFIEDNWQTGRIGDDSFDAKAGSLDNMFNFDQRLHHARKLFLNPESGIRVGHDRDRDGDEWGWAGHWGWGRS
ncbi:phospholipase C [Mangrovitalea sediminis]|uniref:phospholipase C n=1 Tax=Mangrovitalea sediminis TaxID=1982043 RepID=UPI000BE5C11C|nr:alkaline phosphatase family protein [Mangrovitalea sediminis]